MTNISFALLAVALPVAFLELVEGSGGVLSPGFSGLDSGDDGCFGSPCLRQPTDQPSSGGGHDAIIAVIFFIAIFLVFFLWCSLSDGKRGRPCGVSPVPTSAATPSRITRTGLAPTSTPPMEDDDTVVMEDFDA